MKIRIPDQVRVFYNTESWHTSKGDKIVSAGDVSLEMQVSGDSMKVSLTSQETAVSHIRLRWNFTEKEKRHESVKIMGDAWERGYGDIEWRGIVPERFMPWYMLVSNGSDSITDYGGRKTEAFGVAVRPAAICAWQYDTHGVTLWADVRCGGVGVELCGRRLEVCSIFMKEYSNISAFESGRKFCSVMCDDPLPVKHKVYGSNNWYYAIGNSSHEQILRDTQLVCSLSKENENPPYMVIDDGWQPNPCDGPWNSGGEKFPDMKGLASEISKAGALPGIWIRYLNDSRRMSEDVSEDWYVEGRPGTLDPSLPEVIEHVKKDTRRLVEWGYKLIKHDFTTFDIYGQYGKTMTNCMAENGWSFHDRSRTTAEITLDLYRAILEAAGDDCVIIGCNTVSHLSAGLVHLMRIGDDTSGRFWERTRINGVNSLAFRMIQNGAFYVNDADCLGITGIIDWKLNREWLDALAYSGTALFISVNPDVVTEEEKEDLKRALKANSIQNDEMIPLDWMENRTPDHWLINGKEHSFNWYDEGGTHTYIPPEKAEY